MSSKVSFDLAIDKLLERFRPADTGWFVTTAVIDEKWIIVDDHNTGGPDWATVDRST